VGDDALLVTLGEYSIFLALFFAAYAAAAALIGVAGAEPQWLRSAERSVVALFVLVSLSMLGLEAALIGDRFDLAFVAQISAREQPWPFKLALWGGHDGSLLLWTWMLALMSFLVVRQNRDRNRGLQPWVIVSMMANVLFFLGLVAFVSNPFEPLPAGQAYSNGAGMNPLLQHPVMLIHPPILYTGFIAFSVDRTGSARLDAGR
jgi:cytochrome c-type biogenesis protein CcmF